MQLLNVQSNSSTLTGPDHFTSHYEVPGFYDPIMSPSLMFYDNKFDDKAKPNGIYSDSSHYEIDPGDFNSQTTLINENYEMDSPTVMPNGEKPYSVVDPNSHYEMELSNGIYELEADASGYERPVSSRNNTIVRQHDSGQHPVNQVFIYKWHTGNTVLEVNYVNVYFDITIINNVINNLHPK